MPVVGNPQAVHGAWQQAVEAKKESQRPRPPGEEEEEEDETHPWFKSGHARRQDWSEGKNMPEDMAAKGPPGKGAAGIASGSAAASPPAPHLQPTRTVPASPAPGPKETKGNEAFKLPPPPKRPVNVPTKGKPLAEAWELSQGGGKTSGGSWYGENWLDWAGPLAAIIIGLVSIYLFGVGNVEVPQLAVQRYYTPNFKAGQLAARLYDGVKDLPLLCPHGHVDADIFADPSFRFSDPAALFITPDHYVLRMLHSQGVDLALLNVPDAQNRPPAAPRAPRDVWRTFAANFHLFRGTPSALWLRESLLLSFNVTERLDERSADRIYDVIAKGIAEKDFTPLKLLDLYKIEVLATTNGAAEDLAAHARLAQSAATRGRVIPTFRPDDVTDLRRAGWARNVAAMGSLAGVEVKGYDSFLAALRARREQFKALGARASDHGAEQPAARALPRAEAAAIFEAALGGAAAEPAAAAAFSAHMLVESAKMSAADGLVMQLHAGVARNTDPALLAAHGADKGADMPLAADWVRGLTPLLAEEVRETGAGGYRGSLGNHPGLTLVLFSLDESAYSRELAPMAGHWRALRLGPPWWFHDSRLGIRRYLDSVTETAGIANLAGFNDDTRAFLSIPARHTLWRRACADWVAGLHARGVVDWIDAQAMMHDLAYGQAKRTYKL